MPLLANASFNLLDIMLPRLKKEHFYILCTLISLYLLSLWDDHENRFQSLFEKLINIGSIIGGSCFGHLQDNKWEGKEELKVWVANYTHT